MGGGWRGMLLAVAAGAFATLVAAQVAGAQGRGGAPPPSADRIDGTGRGEVLRGTQESDIIFGFGGDDELYGFRSSDLLRGGPGKDALGGGRYGDFLFGDVGPDVITGAGGKDRIFGGKGNDDLYAGFRPGQPVPPDSPARSDFVLGEDGDDFVDSADAPGAPDRVRCGDGRDTVIADREDKVSPTCEVVRRVR
jgi:Ca2+-binding RTX toxin-like protein